MWRRHVTRKRLLQLVGILVAIGIAFALSLGNYEVGNPKTLPSKPSLSTLAP